MPVRPHDRAAAPRQDRAVHTRGAILRAAERIFAEVGLAGARTDAIAAAAHVNKALLYYYFKSKEALHRAVVEDQASQFRQQAFEILDSDGSARSKLLGYVSMYFDFTGSHPYYPRLMQRLVVAGEEELMRVGQEHYAPLYQKLVKVITAGVRDGELRPVDSHHAAFSLVALTAHYFAAAPIVRVVSNRDPHGKANLQRRKKEVLDLVRYGLFRDSEAPLP